MDKKLKGQIIEIAKKSGDDLQYLSDRCIWEYIRDHRDAYKEFFGNLYGEGNYSQELSLTVKSYCPQCEINLIDLQEFRENHPKYDAKMTLTLHQDWFGGDLWHLHKVEFGTYGAAT